MRKGDRIIKKKKNVCVVADLLIFPACMRRYLISRMSYAAFVSSKMILN